MECKNTHFLYYLDIICSKSVKIRKITLTFVPMKRQLRIGFDAKRIVRNYTGLGNYGRTLVNDLSAFDDLDLILYTPDEGNDDLIEQIIPRDNIHLFFPNKKTKLEKALWRSYGIVDQLQKDNIQIYHGLSGELPFHIKKSGIKTVVTIHDLIFLRHPEYYHKIDVFIYKKKFHQAIREADRIIAISECTRRDICEYGNIDKERVDVIYQSCAPKFQDDFSSAKYHEVKSRYHLPDQYILSVGSIEERKNMLLAAQALPYLPANVSLVIVGRKTPYTDKIQRFVNENRLGDRVFIHHGVPNEDLPVFYKLAKCFVYPSRYEGFGIPIIEAIHSGTPVIAATGSCLEEAGGPDCIYISPDDPQALANAVIQLSEENNIQERFARAKAYVKRFENTNVAGQVLDIYRQLADE